MAATELHSDEDSRALADALTKGSGLAAADAPDLVVRAGLALNAGMSRYLLGEDACDALGMQRSPGATTVVRLVGSETRRRFIDNAAVRVDADRSYGRDHVGPEAVDRRGAAPARTA